MALFMTIASVLFLLMAVFVFSLGDALFIGCLILSAVFITGAAILENLEKKCN